MSLEPKDTDDDFDPHDERKVECPIADWETLVHLLKGCIGTGILSMPVAFSHIGLIPGTILTFCVGAFCSYGLQLLIKTEYTLCKRIKVGYLSYPQAMKLAIETGPMAFRCVAPISPYVVNAFLVIYQVGLCTAYIVFVSMNVESVVEHHSDTKWKLEVYSSITFIGCLAISYVPNLKLFAPFSLVANCFVLTSLCIILYYVLQDFPPPSESEMIEPFVRWLQFLGIAFFALESVGVVVEAEQNMKNPKHFCGISGVLNIAIMTVTFLYWLIGFLGFIKYGGEIQDTITLNLPNGTLTSVGRLLVAVAILISFGLQLYPAYEVIWSSYILPRCEGISRKRYWCYMYLLRTACAAVAFCLAYAANDNLQLVLAILGIVCITMLAFIFPALMHLCTCWSTGDFGPHRWYLVKDIMIIISGFAIAVVGLASNINHTVQNKKSQALLHGHRF